MIHFLSAGSIWQIGLSSLKAFRFFVYHTSNAGPASIDSHNAKFAFGFLSYEYDSGTF